MKVEPGPKEAPNDRAIEVDGQADHCGFARRPPTDAIVARRGKPNLIVGDHGTQFASNAMLASDPRRPGVWHFTARGKPTRRFFRRVQLLFCTDVLYSFAIILKDQVQCEEVLPPTSGGREKSRPTLRQAPSSKRIRSAGIQRARQEFRSPSL